ncbi:MAG: sugar phosphate isomerase/epimerase family protein [Flavitalea sp.]
MSVNRSSRRDFLRNTTGLLGITMTGMPFDFKKRAPLLSFSTLGCPDWSFADTVSFAKAHGYQGLEIRGIKRELDLPKCPEFSSPENIRATCKLMEDNGLKFSDLGSSATMHYREGAEREKSLDEGRRFIDLAHEIKCPYIRVFPNDFPDNQEKKETIDLIVKGLITLGEHAKGSNVRVLMESHGKVVMIEDIKTIMDLSAGPNTGMVWDIVNMWSVTKEPPAEAYASLKKYIFHTHLKDMKMVNGKEEYFFLGKGGSPIVEAIRILDKGGYKGYYSWEWEKMWHPEIAEPEIALADFPLAMKKIF